MTNVIDTSRLRDVLDYDRDAGLFRWRVTLSHRGQAGSIAGCRRDDGYIKINIDGKPYMAHRLAWQHVHGVRPIDEIDHINRQRDDNRIANLRPATSKQNKENAPTRSTNTSGHPGVHWDKSREKWMAFITHNRKFRNLGRFDDVEQAIVAADAARNQLFTHRVIVN